MSFKIHETKMYRNRNVYIVRDISISIPTINRMIRQKNQQGHRECAYCSPLLNNGSQNTVANSGGIFMARVDNG
jgi:hypothetical protein